MRQTRPDGSGGRGATGLVSSMAGLLVAGLALAGCGGSGATTPPPVQHPTHHTTHPTGPASSHSPTSTPGGSGSAADVAAIKSAFVTFFSGKTPGSQKITLVEDGPAFSSVINAQAGGSLSQSTTASVSTVTVTSPTQASVVYTVSLGGVPALKNQTGQAVKDGGTWKVSASTFCALLTLEGTAPTLCSTLP